MADSGFSKNLRLLNAAEYETVFENAQIKASCHYLLVLAISNHGPRPRLGMVIAKKHVSSAVQRNRIKRRIRDRFVTLLKNYLGWIWLCSLGKMLINSTIKSSLQS